MNLSNDQLDDLRWSSLLHNVGKIAIDPAIQNKAGNLTPIIASDKLNFPIKCNNGPFVISSTLSLEYPRPFAISLAN